MSLKYVIKGEVSLIQIAKPKKSQTPHESSCISKFNSVLKSVSMLLVVMQKRPHPVWDSSACLPYLTSLNLLYDQGWSISHSFAKVKFEYLVNQAVLVSEQQFESGVHVASCR